MIHLISRIHFYLRHLPLWDERLAVKLASPLAARPLTPNMVTTLNLLIMIVAASLFSTGRYEATCIAALLFMCTGLLDHLDGALARVKNSESTIGYYYDWFTDSFGFCILFISLGIGFRDNLGDAGMLLLGLAVLACLLNTLVGLQNNPASDEQDHGGFPAYAGFSMDDGMYLLGPICWSGYLYTFYILCLAGAVAYVLFLMLARSHVIFSHDGINMNKTIDN